MQAVNAAHLQYLLNTGKSNASTPARINEILLIFPE